MMANWRVCLLILAGAAPWLAESLKISAFNIQVFGRTKAGKADVMETIVNIIRRYDIVLVQEIRDSSNTAINTLMDKVNENSDDYDISISGRLGRTTSKEQYAYIYRRDKVNVVATYQYPDPQEQFQREPFVIRFNSPDTDVEDFVLIGCHTSPDNAREEIDALQAVRADVIERWNVNNVMILGDLNADCKYVSNRSKKKLLLRKDASLWLIGDDEDTTVKTTNCAYDRFIISGCEMRLAIVRDSARVFRFDQEYQLSEDEAKAVSDHYPIELELSETGSSIVCQSTTNRQGTTANLRTTKHPVTTYHHTTTDQPMTKDQPSTTDQQGTTDQQRTTDHKWTTHHKWTTDHPSTTDHQWTTDQQLTKDQQWITDHQSTMDQQRTTDHGWTTTVHRLSTTDHRRTTSDHRWIMGHITITDPPRIADPQRTTSYLYRTTYLSDKIAVTTKANIIHNKCTHCGSGIHQMDIVVVMTTLLLGYIL